MKTLGILVLAVIYIGMIWYLTTRKCLKTMKTTNAGVTGAELAKRPR